MEYRYLGSSGLKVPVLCLGAMTFGEADDKSFMHKVGCDEKTSFAIMSRALERGVGFIDTADVYGQDGLSERIVGAWMAETKSRDRVVLATKFRFRMGEGPNSTGASRYRIVRDGGGQPAAPQDGPHRPLPDPHAGHRHAGRGDAPRARRSRASGQGPLPGREQLRGVPPHRQPVDLEDASTCIGSSPCRCNTACSCATSSASTSRCASKFGLGVLPWSPLAAGFLSGKYAKDQPPPPGVRLEKWKERFADFDNERGWRTLDAVNAIAKEKQTTRVGRLPRVAAREADGHVGHLRRAIASSSSTTT